MRTISRRVVVLVALSCAALTITGIAVQADSSSVDPRLAKADEIATRVSTLRGLAVKRPIKRGVMDKAQIRARILERMDQEYAPAELAAEEVAMKRLGMLPAGYDYKQEVIDLLTDEIAGFYDPWDRQLYIAGWDQAATGFEDGVMAHEIDHALQDQHFDLRSFMKAVKTEGDATSARQALVEGDGMALMLEFMMPAGISPWSDPRVTRMMTADNSATGGSPALAKAPLILREGLIFPYTQGLKFVAHVRQRHPWSRVDAIYKKPPLATEHILHPTKYETYERPDVVKAKTPAALAGYASIYDNVSGELGLAVFLRQHGILQSKAEIAAEGWGGDRLVIYAPKVHAGGVAGTIGVSYAVWDHSADAMEFFDALVDALPGFGGKQTRRTDTEVVYESADGLIVAAERKGDAVVTVFAVPKDRAAALRAEIWTYWKVTRR